jgi:hypothetical protein
MIKTLKLFVSCAILPACGQLTLGGVPAKDSKAAPSEGDLKIKRAPGLTEPVDIAFEAAEGCSKSKDGGLQVTLTQKSPTGTIASEATILMKGLLSNPAEYTCEQTLNNQQGTNSVGDMFDRCFIQVRMASPSNATKFEYFTMTRTDPSIAPFEYKGLCSIKIFSNTPKLKASFDCSNLVKTRSLDNPLTNIDPKNSIDVAGKFSCAFEK